MVSSLSLSLSLSQSLPFLCFDEFQILNNFLDTEHLKYDNNYSHRTIQMRPNIIIHVYMSDALPKILSAQVLLSIYFHIYTHTHI